MDSAVPSVVSAQLGLFWVIFCAILVSTMQAGFCCLESGLVRAKNSVNVAIKNLVDFCIAALIYWAVGFELMFGTSMDGLVGWGLPETATWTGKDYAFFLFQLVFCGTATTIVSGAVAERMSFKGYFLAAGLLAGAIYPVVGHWAWGGVIGGEAGWLALRGFHDFAGSTVVHSVGGWVALAAIIVIGPRIGRFSANGRTIEGHDLPIAVLGVFLLWFGWFGFNGGSTLALTEKVPLILVNTALGGAAGGAFVLITTLVLHRLPRVPLIMNGVIAGLVSVTAGCDHMTPGAATLAGGIGGLLCTGTSFLLDKTRLDDAVGAVPAHLVGGIWGTLAVALLGDPSGWQSGLGRWDQLVVQLEGVVAIGVYSFVLSFAFLWGVDRYIWKLRVSAEHERVGLNISEHGTCTSVQELVTRMTEHSALGDFRNHVEIEPESEAAPIALEYNRVLTKVDQVTSRLRVSEARTSSVLEASAVPILISAVDDGTVLYLNRRAREVLGLGSAKSHRYSEPELWINAAERAAFFSRVERDGKIEDVEARLKTPVGTTFHALISAATMDYDGRFCLCLSFNDISGRKEMEDKLALLASTDVLTSLPNRRALYAQAQIEIARARRFDHPLTVLMIDGDRFKSVNDTFGHDIGDAVLRCMADVIRQEIRTADVPGRLGGEEFVVILPETDMDGAIDLAERLRLAIREASVPLPSGGSVQFTVSIGVALLSENDNGLEALLRRADSGLYKAKHAGRNRVVAVSAEDEHADMAATNGTDPIPTPS